MENEIKFRMLSQEELLPLQKDFVLFLAASGIDADHWEIIKTTRPEEVQNVMAEFSNMVWRKILADKRFMEFEDHHFSYLLFFGEETTEMFRMDKKDPKLLGRRLDKRAESREMAMFQALEAGAKFVEEERYQAFVALWEKRT